MNSSSDRNLHLEYSLKPVEARNHGAAPPASAPHHAAHHTPEEDEIDLLAIFRTLWIGKLWIILFATITTVAGGYYAFFMTTPVYTANAFVVLETRPDQVVELESVVSGLSGNQYEINTQIEILRSRSLIAKLVNELNLDQDPEFNALLREDPGPSIGQAKGVIRDLITGPQTAAPPPTQDKILERTVSTVRDRIQISNLRDTFIFGIAATTQNPVKSALIANTLADLYILDQLDVKFEATQNATNWLTERVATLAADLEAAETAVKEFNAQTDLISPEALEALNRQAKDTRERVASVAQDQAALNAQLAALQQAQEEGDRESMQQVAEKVARTRAPRRIPNPDMTAEQFEENYRLLIEITENAVTRVGQQLSGLQSALAATEQQIQDQSQDLVRLEQLTREAEALRSVYTYFLGRLQETSAQQGIQQSDSRLLSAAIAPTITSAPRRTRIIALAMFLGAFMGAGFVLIREFLNRTIRTAEELANRTGYPVLGQIPLIRGKRKSQIAYIIENPNAAAAEAIRNLRTSITYSNIDRPPQVITLSSSLPGEGKTTLSLLLTQSFAGLNKRVLLIEGDLRRQVFTEYFKSAESAPGLLSVLTGKTALSEAVQRDEFLGADILRAEKIGANAADVFASESFQALIETARGEYDYIIIDTPPVLVVPDARTIAQATDALVFSVKWDSTQHTQVIDALRMFESVNVLPTGLVLSHINPRGMKRYGYGGKYGAYAQYGRKYYAG